MKCESSGNSEELLTQPTEPPSGCVGPPGARTHRVTHKAHRHHTAQLRYYTPTHYSMTALVGYRGRWFHVEHSPGPPTGALRGRRGERGKASISAHTMPPPAYRHRPYARTTLPGFEASSVTKIALAANQYPAPQAFSSTVANCNDSSPHCRTMRMARPRLIECGNPGGLLRQFSSDNLRSRAASARGLATLPCPGFRSSIVGQLRRLA